MPDINSVEHKQAYVFQNIFESDYDIEAFAEYLADQPPKYSSNLEDLSYDTVKISVDSFLEKHKKTSQKQKSNVRQSMEMTESKFERLSVNYDNFDFYSKTRQCVKEINKFALTSINLNIKSFKKNEGGFMSRGFITFKIQLPQLHKQVDRRYSHFEWLRKILGYYHPGVVLPPLPKKKMKKIFTEDHLKKKGRLLQNFLRKCLQIPDLRNDENMYRFLTLPNQQKFEIFLKQNKVEKGIAPFQKIKSATGQLEYGISSESININKKGTQYFQKLTLFMKQLYKEVKRVQQNLNSCSQHLQNLQDLSKRFAPVEEQFRRDCNKKEYSDQEERERSFLETISVLSQKYKVQLKAMKEIWQKQFYMKLKYEFHHTECFDNFINEYRSQEKTFYNMKESLTKKKFKIFNKPMSDWELPEDKRSKFMAQKPSFNQVAPFLLTKKTDEANQFEIIFALQTKQLANSIVHYAKFNNAYNLKTLQKFLQKENALGNEWSQKLKNMMTTQFGFALSGTKNFKEKVGNTGNSIKGFFSQFNNNDKDKLEQRPFKSQLKTLQLQGGIKQGREIYNGM